MDFEIDALAGGLLGSQPLTEAGEGDVVDDDFLACHAAA